MDLMFKTCLESPTVKEVNLEKVAQKQQRIWWVLILLWVNEKTFKPFLKTFQHHLLLPALWDLRPSVSDRSMTERTHAEDYFCFYWLWSQVYCQKHWGTENQSSLLWRSSLRAMCKSTCGTTTKVLYLNPTERSEHKQSNYRLQDKWSSSHSKTSLKHRNTDE